MNLGIGAQQHQHQNGIHSSTSMNYNASNSSGDASQMNKENIMVKSRVVAL